MLNVSAFSYSNSVCRWSSHALSSVKTFFSFPLRYFGSKSALNYHFTFEKELTSKALGKYMPYAYINASTYYHHDTKKVEEHGFKPLKITPSSSNIRGFTCKDHHYIQTNTGVVISFFSAEGKVVVSIGALGASEKLLKDKKQFNGNWWSGVKSSTGNLFGGVPKRYTNTHLVVKELLKNKDLKSKKVILTGNCIGGSIASYIGLKEKIPTVCINPLPLGAGIQKEIGNKSLSEADNFITNITVKSDWASDLILSSIFDRALSFLRLRTPGVFGHRYSVPTQYKWNIFASHSRVLSNFKAHLNS